MTLQIYTSTIRTKDPDRLNITVKNQSIFSPSWDIVMGLKNKTITEDEYTEQYYYLMRRSYQQNMNVWNNILRRKRIVFCCYCPKDTFCHRLLLKDIFLKIGQKYIGTEYGGEIE